MPELTAPDGALFDMRAPGFLSDPYPYFHRLRSAAPLYCVSPGVWIASRYDDVQFVLGDARFGKCVPLTAVMLGTLALGETLSAGILAGFVLILTGAAMVSRRR